MIYDILDHIVLNNNNYIVISDYGALNFMCDKLKCLCLYFSKKIFLPEVSSRQGFRIERHLDRMW